MSAIIKPPTGIRYYPDLIQGSEEWIAARLGLLTASEMKLIVTPTLKIADNEKTRAHVYELAVQRVTEYVEPRYISDDMLRGHEDEVEARLIYHRHYAPVTEMGFITNDKWGFTLGYSPDGLVGDDGAIEAKSRRQKYHFENLVEFVPGNAIHPDYVIQSQTGLLVSEREWIDHISHSGGLPMSVIRVYPNAKIQEAILAASAAFERKVSEKLALYHEVLASKARLVPTERRVVQEMYV